MEHSEHHRPLGSTSAFWIGAALVAAACAALLYALGPYFSDVTYLIIVNERMFEGERLYVDVRDINPPFSVWLYTPYVALQNLTGISAYVWIGFGLTLCLGVSLLLIDYLLREGLNVPVQRARRAALYIALIALIIMPTQFAQREHFCTIAALPWLFLLGARVETGFRPSRAMTILIGVLGSALLILKPHYALGYGLPLLFLAWRRKDWRLLFVPEALVIALMVPVYWTVAYFAAPGFFTEMLPIGMTVYQIQFASTQHLLLMGTLINLPALLVLYWTMRTNRSANSITIFLLIASLGFVVAYILQGKGWPYHQLPAALTILSAAIYENITQDGPASLSRLRKIGRNLIIAIALFIGLQTSASFQTARVPAEIHAMTHRPTLFVISIEIGVGTAITRQLKADWIDRDPCDIIAMAALVGAQTTEGQRARQFRAFVNDWIAHRRDVLLSAQPDLVIIDESKKSWSDLILSDAAIASELKNYDLVTTVNDVSYLIRSDLVSGS